MRKNLAVVSAEPGYAERFCRAVNSRENYHFTAVPFTDAAALFRFAETKPVSAVLADEEFGSVLGGDSGGELPGRPALVLLSTGKGIPGRVFRYQGVTEILRQLGEICGDTGLAGLSESAGRRVRVTGIYSPASQILKSAVSLAAAAGFGREEKVLYLNLEEFSGLRELFRSSAEKTLSDAVCHLKQGTLTAGRAASLIRSSVGFDYIAPVRFAEDLRLTSGEDWVRLLYRLSEVTSYTRIVTELPQPVAVSAELMEICDSILLPFGRDGISAARIREFEAWLEQPGQEKIRGKVRHLEVPEELFEAASGGSRRDGRCDCPEDLIYSSFGELVIREALSEAAK